MTKTKNSLKENAAKCYAELKSNHPLNFSDIHIKTPFTLQL